MEKNNFLSSSIMSSAKLSWANDLRAFAVIAVIVLHVDSTIAIDYPDIPNNYLLTSLFFDAAVRWCVPVFIMLSGSFALEHYDGRLKNFFIKMFYRIILPFLFWSIIYLLAFSWTKLNDPSKSTAQIVSFIGNQFLTGTASHLWFVYVIVSLYLTFPILSKWTKNAVEKEYIYFIGLWIIFIITGPYLSQYEHMNFDFSFFTGCLGFIILGNYLFKTNRKINRLALAVLFITAYLYTAIRSYFISVHTNEFNESFLENLSLNVALLSFCVYLFFKNHQYFTHPAWRRIMDIISANSYGIYLSHLLILNIFLWLGLSFCFAHPLFSIPLVTLACLVISTALVMVMKKIPFLKMLTG